MEVVIIDHLPSDEIRAIEISTVSVDASFTLKVRKFFPFECNMLQEAWTNQSY